MDLEKLLKDTSTFVLDVRTPMEFKSGALNRAVLIPINQLERRIDELPTDKKTSILVYCAHGIRSRTGVRILEAHGYTSVFNLEGGLAAYGQKSFR